MRSSSSLFAPSAIAILSMLLLCSLSGTAVSQTATGSAAPLPSITVDAPKPVARPNRPVATPQGSGRVARRAGRTSRSIQTATGTPSAAQGPVMAKLARLEREASSCNDGCESSFKRGKDPWVGCSESADQFSQQRAKTHSPTGTTRNAWKPKCSWAGTDNDPGGIAPACWLGGNFGSPHKIETGSALESRLNSGQLNRVSFVFGQPDRNVVTALATEFHSPVK